MNAQATSAAPLTPAGTPQDLFVLSDEQILEIEPETEVATNRANSVVAQHAAPAQIDAPEANNGAAQGAQTEAPVLLEPPPWLAAQMKDPWSGEEAREFWNGVQQARQEAAAYQVYRAAIASPEDARAMKELYPGGIAEARAAADRARLLEEIDRAYFGVASATPEQLSASRSQLAQRMLREDPAAFREMVVAGLRALEETEKGSGASTSPELPRLAKLFAQQGAGDVSATPPFRAASSTEAPATNSFAAVAQHSFGSAQDRAAPRQGNAAGSPAPGPQALHQSAVASHESLSAYAAFERAANEDLERSVGSAIERTLEQALPGVARHTTPGQAGAQHSFGSAQDRAAPLQQKLATAIRQDIEHALQGDRQLSEQVAQILASRRFDNDTRAQVVRLINERAQQLVPGAAKRILNEWTQTTLAAHRTRSQRESSAAHRVDLAPAEVAPVDAEPRRASSPARANPRNADARRLEASATNSPRRVDYRKLSDEQILDMG
jgi:hypothetical protein